MRKIKFRAWDKQNKNMIKSYAHGGANGRLYTIEGNDPIGELELMQYTGLKDKNRNEIYEGDVLAAEGYSNLIVAFDRGGFRYYHRGDEICDSHSLYDVCEGYEVIGNIYENPELLEDSL